MEWNSDTIRALRKSLELSQEEFAERLRVSFETVKKWEAKPSRMAVERLDDFAKEVGYNPISQDRSEKLK